MRYLKDVTLHISANTTGTAEETEPIELVRHSMMYGEPVIVQDHTGYVVDVHICQKHECCVAVLMKHSGIPTCNCELTR